MGLKNSVLHVHSSVEKNIKDELVDIRRIFKAMDEERTRVKERERDNFFIHETLVLEFLYTFCIFFVFFLDLFFNFLSCLLQKVWDLVV